MNALSLTEDLLSSYYNLYRQFQKSILFEENSAQQKQLQALFETEWKKIDILQLKHDYDQLKKEHQSTDEKLAHLRDELQRIQSERDQLQREQIQMAQEIDRLKSATPTNVIVQSDQVQTNFSIKKNINDQINIIDQLQDLLPHQIKTEQAEQFIQEIYHRRTTFDDPDMRKSICGSLKHLGSDLYSSSVHFLHELIQVNSTYFQTQIYSFFCCK
jgi:predicted  nucleic acid-binding Zn-ribbon protein